MYRDPLEPRPERRRWGGAATGVALVAIVAAGLAVWSWRAADDARNEAFLPPNTIDNPTGIPQAGRDLANDTNLPAGTAAPAPAALPAETGMAQIGATPAAVPPADGNLGAAPVGRSFEFQPLPNATAGTTVAEGPVPPVRADAAAADATVGTPAGERAAPPAEVAAQANIGTTPATQTLENAGDVTAAIVGGQEATVKGKVERFDEQARTVTLDNGDAYVLADNLRVGEGALTADTLQAGNDVQLVFRTDADRKVVISLTAIPDTAGAAAPGVPPPATN